jgi:hypothetical protein
MKIDKTTEKLLHDTMESSRCLLQWWFDFTWNIIKQGWISDNQKKKLYSFNLNREMLKTYGCASNKKQSWTSGLDHDDIADYTG